MPLEQFLSYFNEHGIGYCFKRRGHTDTTVKYKRPIIGRLGIGMLAIGQLCHSFEIESHYKDESGEGKAYHAEIILLDEAIPGVEESISKDTDEKEDLEVGTWSYESIPFENSKMGFRLFSNDVRDTFTDEMVLRPEVQKLFDKIKIKLDRTVSGSSVKSIPMAKKENLTVTLKDGIRHSKDVELPKGHWRLPVPREGILEKYRDCASRALPSKAAENALELLEHLEDLANINELMGIVTG